MRFETSQHMKLSQQMKLAPRMIQSMEILQLPMLALQERIEQELESNIALEQVEPTGDGDATAGDFDDDARSERVEQKELVVGENEPTGEDDWERLRSFETTYRDSLENEYSSRSVRRTDGERDGKMDAMAGIPARSESLSEQLMHQWAFAEVDDAIADIGRRLIGYIDDDGLLSTDLPAILEQVKALPDVDITLENLEEALAQLQHWLDPPGLAARDHRECFLLQIDRLLEAGDDEADEDWDLVRTMAAEHYDDLLQNRLPRIAQALSLEVHEVQQAIDLMRRLRVNPGREIASPEAVPIMPDVVVEWDEQTEQYVAMLSDGILPILRVNNKYAKMAKDREQERETREFLTNSVRNATWLIESINQRKNTLLRVVNVVLARQHDFFEHGPQHLRPLPMTEVADQLGIHVATVSRAVADKWIVTPRGLMPLRKFFSGGTDSETGEKSWEAVKAILREIIDGEDKAKPLSDEALSKALKQRGIDIARRTVVKYRQQMNIPPARRRKQY
jgi:RNA polymerase sigma-54 factor